MDTPLFPVPASPAARAPAWWEGLLARFPDGLVPTEELFQVLMEPHRTWRLTGIAQEGDPFVAVTDAPGEQMPRAGVVLDGATLVAIEAPGENGVSECDSWRITPGEHLRTRLAPLPVRVEASDSSRWDDPSKNEGLVPVCVDLVSVHTDSVLVQVGTEFQDPYYPGIVFLPHPEAITQATPMALSDHLGEALPQGTPTGARARL